MRGTLACERCVIDYGWNCCTTTKGGFIDGHVAAPEGEVDVDSWSHHLEAPGWALGRRLAPSPGADRSQLR